jgi:hypothetical protein
MIKHVLIILYFFKVPANKTPLNRIKSDLTVYKSAAKKLMNDNCKVLIEQEAKN